MYEHDNVKPQFKSRDDVETFYAKRKAWCARFEREIPLILRITAEARLPMPNDIALGSLHWDEKVGVQKLHLIVGLVWGDERRIRINVNYGTGRSTLTCDVEDTLALVRGLREGFKLFQDGLAEMRAKHAEAVKMVEKLMDHIGAAATGTIPAAKDLYNPYTGEQLSRVYKPAEPTKLAAEAALHLTPGDLDKRVQRSLATRIPMLSKEAREGAYTLSEENILTALSKQCLLVEEFKLTKEQLADIQASMKEDHS